MIAVQGRCFQSLFLSFRTDCRRVQRNCLQACSGRPSFFFLFTGNTFPSLPIYWSISSSIRLLFSTWDEISSNMSVSRMACKVTAARRFFSSFIWAPSRLSSTSPALSRSSDVITGAIPSVPEPVRPAFPVPLSTVSSLPGEARTPPHSPAPPLPLRDNRSRFPTAGSCRGRQTYPRFSSR